MSVNNLIINASNVICSLPPKSSQRTTRKNRCGALLQHGQPHSGQIEGLSRRKKVDRITVLPTELQSSIFNFLTVKGAIALAQSCKTLAACLRRNPRPLFSDRVVGNYLRKSKGDITTIEPRNVREGIMKYGKFVKKLSPPDLSGAKLDKFVDCFPNIVKLDALYCDLTDDMLKKLQEWRTLKNLSMAGQKNITRICAENMPPMLEELDVSDCALTHDSSTDLKKLSNLKVLYINQIYLGDLRDILPQGLKIFYSVYSHISSDDCTGFATFPALEKLILNGNHDINDAIAVYLPASLRELQLNSCRLTNDACQRLQHLDHLERLDIGGNDITDLGDALPGSLTRLDAEWCRLTDKGCSGLQRLQKLEVLILGNNEELRGTEMILPPNLIHLDISKTDINDLKGLGLRKLKKLKKLSLCDNFRILSSRECLPSTIKELELRNCSLDNERCRPLRKLKKCKKLDLSGNDSLTNIRRVLPPNLTTLRISYCNLDNDGCRGLRTLTKLIKLELSENKRISDLRGVLPTSIEELHLDGCSLTNVGAQTLRRLKYLEVIQFRGNPDITDVYLPPYVEVFEPDNTTITETDEYTHIHR